MIAMPDSITPANLPPGYDAYLAYVDGVLSEDADTVRSMFTAAHILTLTVLGGAAKADGCDRENGDLTAAAAAEWLHLAITAGQWRPVLYASRDNVPAVLDVLSRAHVTPEQIRILSAHYGLGTHICSPSACGASFTADGTQWTDAYPGVGGALIDMSALADDFFGPPAGWVFSAVRDLTARAGRTSVSLAWSAPDGPAPEAVDHYQITVRQDGQDVPTYPRKVAKAANPQVWQGGSLPSGTVLEALVRAVAVDGHASPWAAVTFRTAP